MLKDIDPIIIESALQLLIKHHSQAVMIFDQNGQLIFANSACNELTGFSKKSLTQQTLRPPHSIQNHLCTHLHWKGQISLPHQSLRYITIGAQIFRLQHLTQYIDIQIISSDHHHIDYIELWKLAHTDKLTGLVNQATLLQCMKQKIQKKTAFAFIYMDLDGFKEINDLWGHAVGDQLLKKISKRLLKPNKDIKLICRIQGDEFGIVIEDDEACDYRKTAKQVLSVLKKPFSLQGHTIYISACIGISSYPKDGNKVQMLINYADEAMRHAKIFGPHQIIFFDPIKHLVEFEQLLLSQDVKQAFIKHQLEVYFQPILECRHKKILKAEALLRWNHPSKGIMTTIEFLPLIKRNDAIIEINLWIFKEVCRHLQQWLTNYPDLQISINTPALLFEYPDHPFQHWQHILETYQINPNRIIIEITEEALFRPNIQTLKKIKMLQDQGFGLALDDFGTGYSSIEYLKHLNPNYLKLNHVFTKHVLDNQKNELLCKTMIDLAHGLHMKVIAEDVEKIEIQNKLEQLGIDFSQGYLIGKPMNAVNFEQHLD